MPEFLFQMSDFPLFCLLSVFFILTSLVGVLLLRLFIPHEIRFKENAILGNVSATISVIHGVLVGMIALYLINTISYASDAVQHEANAAGNIYRDSLWLKNPLKTAIRSEIRQYLSHAITSDWGFMSRGKLPDGQGNLIIETISRQLAAYPQTTLADRTIMARMLDEVSQLYSARGLRIGASTIAVGQETWIVILIGTFLTIGINYFFGMNFYLHMLATTALGLMMAAILFLLITLDKPFQGQFVVGPDPLQKVLDHVVM